MSRGRKRGEEDGSSDLDQKGWKEEKEEKEKEEEEEEDGRWASVRMQRGLQETRRTGVSGGRVGC